MTRYAVDYGRGLLGRHTVLSAPQQICASIEQLILDGTFTPGDRLPRVDHMAERFGVSAPTAHSALRTLRDAGILSATRGRGGGYRVTSAALDAIDAQTAAPIPPDLGYAQLLEVREVQDVLAARAAAAHRSPEDARMLESVLDGPEPLDAERAFTLDLRFHRTLAWCTHNPLIVGFTGATALALRRFPRSPELAPQEIVAELDAVAHAVGRRDGGAAAQAMRRHLRRSADFFRSASLIAADG